MADTTRNLDIIIRVQDQATAQLARLEASLTAFGRSVAGVQQRAPAAVATVGPGARLSGGGATTQMANQAAQAQIQAANRAAQAQRQAAANAAQGQMQAARLAATTQIAAANQAATTQIAAANRASREQIAAANRAAQAQRQAAANAAQAQMQAARQAQEPLEGLVATLSRLRVGFALVGAYLGGQFLASVLQVSGQMQSLKQSFEAMAGGAEQGKEQFQFVRQAANDFGFVVTDMAANYRQLMAATIGTNIPLAQQQELFLALAASARVAGSSQDAVSRAIIQMGQGLGRGKLETEDLKTIAEAIPGAMARMGQALGKTTGDLLDMAEKSQLVTDVWLPAFIKAMGSDVPKALQIAATNFEAGANRMKNSWNEFLEALGNSAPFRGARENLSAMAKWMHDVGAQFGWLEERFDLSKPAGQLARINEEMALLRRETDVVGQLSEATTKKLQALEAQRLTIIEAQRVEAQKLKDEAAAQAPGKAFEAAAKAWQATMKTIDQTLAVMRQAGVPELQQLNEELSINRKRQGELVTQLAQTTTGQQAAREVMQAEYQDLVAREQAITGVIDAEKERQSRQREAAQQEEQQRKKRLADLQQEADLRERLKQDVFDAAALAQLGSEEERKAEERRRTFTRGKFDPKDVEDLVYIAAQTDADTAANQRREAAIQHADEAYHALYTQLNQDLETYQLALDENLTREEAEAALQIARLQRTPEETDALMQKAAALRAATAQYERQNALLQEQQQIQQQIMAQFEDTVRPRPRSERERLGQDREDLVRAEATPAQLAQFDRLAKARIEAVALNDVLEGMRDTASSLGDTLEQGLVDVLLNASEAGKTLGETMEAFGKGLIKLFGEELIKLGMIPLRQALDDFATALAKSETIQTLVKFGLSLLGGAAGSAAGGVSGVSGTGGAATFGPLGVAHGAIFGTPIALQRGGLITSPVLMGEATPEAVVPLTAEGISRFTRGLSRGAGEGQRRESPNREHDTRRWQETIDALAKRPVVLEVTIQGLVDPRKLGIQPEEVVQIVGKDIVADGVTRRLILKHAQK